MTFLGDDLLTRGKLCDLIKKPLFYDTSNNNFSGLLILGLPQSGTMGSRVTDWQHVNSCVWCIDVVRIEIAESLLDSCVEMWDCLCKDEKKYAMMYVGETIQEMMNSEGGHSISLWENCTSTDVDIMDGGLRERANKQCNNTHCCGLCQGKRRTNWIAL